MGLFRKKSAPAPAQTKNTSFAEVIVTNSYEGVVVIDAARNIQFVNPALERLAEVDEREVVGFNFELYIKLEGDNNPILSVIATGRPAKSRGTSLVAMKSGRKTPVEVVALPVDGSVIATLRNIEQEKKEEAEKDDFISTASHEMRTPVASIDGFLSLALNEKTATIDERARDYLTKAQAASKHLGKLFQDLLDTTKMDDGRLKPTMQPLEMVPLVREIAEGMMPVVSAKGLTFSFNDAGAGGSGKVVSQVLYAMADPEFLRESLNNIIDNAAKYTERGGIRVDVSGDAREVTIAVADSGIGISQTDLQHIFQKFYRADNDYARASGGTGLGLYIVKQRVEAMGGRVAATSEPGRGSVFYIILPRLTQEEYNRRKMLEDNKW